MEITSSVEKLAQDWKLKIKDWNLNARLAQGVVLADDKNVVDPSLNYSNHGRDFGTLGSQDFRMTIGDVKKAHPEACFLAVFEHHEGDIVFYRSESSTLGGEQDKRTTVAGDCLFYFLFNKGDGLKFIDDVRLTPDLPDLLVKIEFPIYKNNLKDWKELIYLPQELSFKERNNQLNILATR